MEITEFYKRVENTVEKGEIARYEQFLLFPQCFQKTCTADTNFKVNENGGNFSKMVENTVGKGEIARYEQFLLFPHCFQKTSTADTDFKVDENGGKFSKRVENTVGKGEIARYKQFLLFTLFSKDLYNRYVKIWACLGKAVPLEMYFYHIITHNACFPCNIAITNFLVSHTCEIIFHDVTDRTVHMFTSRRHPTQRF